MAAFGRAVDLGYRYLETDVRATRDGQAVIFHDATLQRVTDGRGRLDGHTREQLRTVRVRGREPIPLLTDLLDAWPDARFNLDVKCDAAVGPTVDAIRRTGALPRVCIGSFSARRLRAVRAALGPALCTSLAPRDALAVRYGRPPGAGDCTQVPPRLGIAPLVDRRYLDHAHRLRLPVHVWTINRADEMHRLLDLGVDGIMTDRADLLRDVLRSRGAWA